MYVQEVRFLVSPAVSDSLSHLQSLGFPPPETKAESLEILGGIDPLGVEISAQQLEQIQELEANDHHATFIVLSDVHLDDPQVMKHLDLLFQGLESVMPSLFILMGDFMSTSMGGGGTGSYTLQDLKEYLDELGNLILKYPELAQFSKFVLVPGPNDPGSSSAFPRHPVRYGFRRCMRDKEAQFHGFASSRTCARKTSWTACRTSHAARIRVGRLLMLLDCGLLECLLCVVLTRLSIRYYTQDIVVFREDLHQKMHRHALLPVVSDDTGESRDAGQHEHVDVAKHVCHLI